MDAYVQALAASEGIAESEASLWVYPGLRTRLSCPTPVGYSPAYNVPLPPPTGVVAVAQHPSPAERFSSPAEKAVFAIAQAKDGTPWLLACESAGLELATTLLFALRRARRSERAALVKSWTSYATRSYTNYLRRQGIPPEDVPEPGNPHWILLGAAAYEERPPVYGLLKTALIDEEEHEPEDPDNPTLPLDQDLGADDAPWTEGLSIRGSELFELREERKSRLDLDTAMGDAVALGYGTVTYPIWMRDFDPADRPHPVQNTPRLPAPTEPVIVSMARTAATDGDLDTTELHWHKDQLRDVERFTWPDYAADEMRRMAHPERQHDLPPYSDANGEALSLGEAVRNYHQTDRPMGRITSMSVADVTDLPPGVGGRLKPVKKGRPKGSFKVGKRFYTREDRVIQDALNQNGKLAFPVPFYLARDNPRAGAWIKQLYGKRIVDTDASIDVAAPDPEAWYRHDQPVKGREPWARLTKHRLVKGQPDEETGETADDQDEASTKRIVGPMTRVGEQVGLLQLDKLVYRMRNLPLDPAQHGPGGELVAPILTTLWQWIDGITGKSTLQGRNTRLLRVEGERTSLAEQVGLHRLLKERGRPFDQRVLDLWDTLDVGWVLTRLAPALQIGMWGLTYLDRRVHIHYTAGHLENWRSMKRALRDQWVAEGAWQLDLEQLFLPQQKRGAIHPDWRFQDWTLDRVYRLATSVEFLTEDAQADKPVDRAVVLELLRAAGFPEPALARTQANLRDTGVFRLHQIPGLEWVGSRPGDPRGLLGDLAGTWKTGQSLGAFLATIH